jgi:hypothetical protein
MARRGDSPSGPARDAWDAWYEALHTCRVLCLDEAHIAGGSDRAASLLLAIIDRRVTNQRVVHLALNAEWDALRADPSKLLQQVREKLAACTAPVLFPGPSRRTTVPAPQAKPEGLEPSPQEVRPC